MGRNRHDPHPSHHVEGIRCSRLDRRRAISPGPRVTDPGFVTLCITGSALILGLVLGAGCMDPPLVQPEPRVTSFTLQVGDNLASFSDVPYNANSEPARRVVVQPVDILPTHSGIGLLFDGIYGAADAHANLTLLRGTGSATFANHTDDENITQVLYIDASPGQPNGDGRPIRTTWTFQDRFDVAPGLFNLTIQGTGRIDALNHQVYGIPNGTATREAIFAVPSGTTRAEILIQSHGVGTAPTLLHIAPDGTLERIGAPNEQGSAFHEIVAPRAGQHVLRLESDGWAGTVGFRIESVPGEQTGPAP